MRSLYPPWKDELTSLINRRNSSVFSSSDLTLTLDGSSGANRAKVIVTANEGTNGLIAEEVGEIAPQYVHWRDATEEDDPAIVSSNGLVAEGVMYERLVVPLIKQVQKLTAKVEALEEELKALKK